jgi:hypothetical protein
MKTLKNISIAIFLLLLASAAFSQEQCELKLSDASPHTGQYSAYIVIYYDNVFESITSEFDVELDAPNYLPFGVAHEVEDNLYRIAVWVREPQTGLQGPYWSDYFNTDFWRYQDVKVEASL